VGQVREIQALFLSLQKIEMFVMEVQIVEVAEKQPAS